MAEHVYKQIELTGSSTTDMEGAVRNAIAKAGESVRNLEWFSVVETRGRIENETVAHWQVTVKLGFRVE